MLGLLTIVVIVCLAYIVISLAPVSASGRKKRLNSNHGPVKGQPLIIIVNLDCQGMMETIRHDFNSRPHGF